jgi:hypothetical protein
MVRQICGKVGTEHSKILFLQKRALLYKWYLLQLYYCSKTHTITALIIHNINIFHHVCVVVLLCSCVTV